MSEPPADRPGGKPASPAPRGLPRYPNEFELPPRQSRWSLRRLLSIMLLSLVLVGILGALFLPDALRQNETFQAVGGLICALAFLTALVGFYFAVALELRRQRRIEREHRDWNE